MTKLIAVFGQNWVDWVGWIDQLNPDRLYELVGSMVPIDWLDWIDWVDQLNPIDCMIWIGSIESD